MDKQSPMKVEEAESGRINYFDQCINVFLCSCIRFKESDDVVYRKPKSPLRWIVLVLACLMLVGSYYVFDLPASCKTQIEAFMGYDSNSEFYFSLLYTLYAIPNVILPFFGGYFVDKLGVRLCLLIFAALIAIGQVIFSFGLSIKSWPCMFIGRFIFGLGGESLTVANSALLADWFKGKELAFAFGVNLSIARLGSVMNNLVSPALTISTGLEFAFWFGAIMCAGSVFCVILTLPIDKAFDERLKWQSGLTYRGDAESDYLISDSGLNKNDVSANLLQSSSISEEQKGGNPRADSEEPQFRDIFKLSFVFWMLTILCFVIYGCVLPFNNIASSFLLERDYFITPPIGCALTYSGCEGDGNQPNSFCPSSQWYQPPLPYNLTVEQYDGAPSVHYINVAYTDVDCTNSFWSACTATFCSRLAEGQSKSAVIMSIPYIISAALSPIVGIFIDKFGFRAVISAISPLILVIVHSLLAFTKVDPIGPMVGQGLAYVAFAAAMWPSVPLVVSERLTGLGFGITTSALNIALTVVPTIIAAIFKSSGDLYIPNVEILFIFLGVVGFIVGVYLNYYDMGHDSILNRGEVSCFAKPPAEQSQYLPPEPLDSAFASVSSGFNPILKGGIDGQMGATVNIGRSRDVGPRSTSTSDNPSGSYVSFVSDRRAQSTSSPSFDTSSGDRKRGGSFTRHEEIHRGGAF